LEKHHILQAGPYPQWDQEPLDEAFHVHRYFEAADKQAFLAEHGPKIEGIATRGELGANRAMIEACPNLKVISVYGVGYDAVDLAACRERGIKVSNTPDVLTDDVADLAIGLMLAALRGIATADRYVRAGLWLRAHMPLQTRMSGKRLGIVGMGRIGQAIARRASAFGMSISWNGPRPKDLPWRYEPDLQALARSVDVLVAACPGGAATRGLISRAVLEALGPGVFVNIARGSVVDEAALVDLLVTQRLGGAALDVFADEPRVPEALFALDQVVLQPHQASATRETRGAMGQLVLDNIAAHVAGRPLLTPVN
jgi:lactate dehydrogenase-like 2-hydroxyacid dehydrogenase